MYRSHSHPALLSLVPTLIPPSGSRSRSPSPPTVNNNDDNTSISTIPTSPTNSELPNLRFLEFEAPPSPPTLTSSALSFIPPPPPPPPLPSPTMTSPQISLRTRSSSSSQNNAPLHAPKLDFTRNRKSPPSQLPPTIPEESSPHSSDDNSLSTSSEESDIGIKPRSKLGSSTNATLSLEADPFAPPPPTYYIPPPPPLPPPPQAKLKGPTRFTKNGPKSRLPFTSKPIVTRPKTNFAPNPSTSIPQPIMTNQQQAKALKFQQHLFAIPPAIPAPSSSSDSAFSLPRTIRKSSEALIVSNRKRLSKSGTLPPRIAPLLIGGRPVRPTSIFGSYEPEFELETENVGPPNVETINLHSCHELDPDSLLCIGNLFGELIRSIDLSLCPINDAILGEFAQLCTELKHLAIRYCYHTLYCLFFDSHRYIIQRNYSRRKYKSCFG